MYTVPSEGQPSPSKFGMEFEVNKLLKNGSSVGNLREGSHIVGKGGNAYLSPFHRGREML